VSIILGGYAGEGARAPNPIVNRGIIGGRIVIETDPYSILGIARGCTPEEAREAYRAGVRTLHPDHGGDEAAFIRHCAAYRQVVEELERPAASVAAAPSPGPGPHDPRLDRRAYVAWVREHARSAAGRRRRRAWWRKHPKLARAILFGLIAAFGGSILGVTLILGPAMLDRAERRAKAASRAKVAPRSPARSTFEATRAR
jgi:hypothetical protein